MRPSIINNFNDKFQNEFNEINKFINQSKEVFNSEADIKNSNYEVDSKKDNNIISESYSDAKEMQGNLESSFKKIDFINSDEVSQTISKEIISKLDYNNTNAQDFNFAYKNNCGDKIKNKSSTLTYNNTNNENTNTNNNMGGNIKNKESSRMISKLPQLSPLSPTIENLFNDYVKKLKLYNFPSLKFLLFEEKNSETLFKFFDMVIHLKSSIINEKSNYQSIIQNIKQQNTGLLLQNSKLEKEIARLQEENKSIIKLETDKSVYSVKKQNEGQLLVLKQEIVKLKNRNSQLLVEKNNIIEREFKISEAFNKLSMSIGSTEGSFGKSNSNINNNAKIANKSQIKNSFSITDKLKNNNLLKRLQKSDGSEKLIECLQLGMNSVFKDLLNDINSLKSFIYKINEIIRIMINKLVIKKSEEMKISINNKGVDSKDIINFKYKSVNNECDASYVESRKDSYNYIYNKKNQFNSDINYINDNKINNVCDDIYSYVDDTDNFNTNNNINNITNVNPDDSYINNHNDNNKLVMSDFNPETNNNDLEFRDIKEEIKELNYLDSIKEYENTLLNNFNVLKNKLDLK